MRRFVPRRSFAAALLIFASATTAHAECAWVLWVHSTGLGGGSDPRFQAFFDDWKRLDAYDSKVACRAALEAKLKRRPGDPFILHPYKPDTVVLEQHLQEEKETGQAPNASTYFCWPSDPGGWVLWSRLNSPTVDRPYQVEASYESKMQCEESVEWKSTRKFNPKRTTTTYGEIYKYLCLPGTTIPR
jgi:hypothetical protein